MTPRTTPARALLVLVMAVVLGMTPWFSATAVLGAMVRELGAPPARGAWLTLGVQIGFVVGSLISATLVLSDRWSPRKLAAWCAAAAAGCTALLAVPGVSIDQSIALRVAVGAALAGVYPPGIKLAAGWSLNRRGLAIGLLVGGTTLGSAFPHLLRAAVPPSAWRAVIVLSAACALAGAGLFWLVVREGPFQAPSAPFEIRAIRRVAGNRAVVLATGGYLGHMWELYAMWSSIALFFQVVADRRDLAAWFLSCA